MENVKLKFEKELEELGVLEQFKTNIRNRHNDNERSIKASIDNLNEEKTFNEFVSGAFVWINTPEGWNFWAKIADI